MTPRSGAFTLGLLGVLALIGCARESQEFVLPPGAPRIEAFTASSTSIKPGEQVTLSFKTQGASEAKIIDHLGTTLELEGTAAEGSAVVSPTERSFYVLRVTGAGGRVSAFVRIDVSGVLEQASLMAVPPSVDPGEEVQLIWSARDAASVSLVNGEGESLSVEAHQGSGMITVHPLRTTSYTLTATSPSLPAPLTAEATVHVRAQLRAFTLSSYAIPKKGTVTFQIDVAGLTGGTFAITEAALGAVATGTLSAEGTASSTYVLPESVNGEAIIDGTPLFFNLQIKNAAGDFVLETTARAKVGVGPAILAFTAPTHITAGDPVTLSWDVIGASKLRIVREATGLAIYSPPPGSAELSKGAFALPSPTSQEQYHLEVEDSEGNADRETVTIQVEPRPTVTLSVPSTPVPAGNPVKVDFTSTNASRVLLRLQDGPQLEERTLNLAAGSFTFRPATTQWVTVEAWNRAKTKVSASARIRVNALSNATVEITPAPAFVGDPLTLNVDLTAQGYLEWLPGLPTSTIRKSSVPADQVDATFFSLENSSTAKAIDFGNDRDNGRVRLTGLEDFHFPFVGTTQDDFFVSVNGALTFADAGPLNVPANFTLTNTAPMMIAPFWQDLALPNPGTDNPNPSVLYELEGSVFPRTLVVQWNDVAFAGGPGRLTFQARLSESGAVRFVYGELRALSAGNAGGEIATIGVNLGSGLFSAQHSAPGVPTVQEGLAIEFLHPKNDVPHQLSMTAVQRGEVRFFGWELDTVSGMPRYTTFSVPANVFSPNDLLISEVMPNPHPGLQGNNGIWVELFNPSSQPLDLGGLTLSSTTMATSFPIPQGERVEAGGYYLLGATNVVQENGGLPTLDEPFGAALQFDRQSDAVELKVGANTVSRLAWESPEEAVAISAPDPTVTSSGTNLTCSETVPYGTHDQLGSPRARNRPCFPYELSEVPVAFQDISQTGTSVFPALANLSFAVATVDVSRAPVTLWGQLNSTVEVNGCGWIGPQGTPYLPGYCYGSPDPVLYPSGATPNGAIAVFGDRLDDQVIDGVDAGIFMQRFEPGQSSLAPEGHWVFQWHRVEYFDNRDDLNFQVKFFDSGVIEFHYGLMKSRLASKPYGTGMSATIWLENPAGEAALSLGTLTSPPTISSFSAYRFTPVSN